MVAQKTIGCLCQTRCWKLHVPARFSVNPLMPQVQHPPLSCASLHTYIRNLMFFSLQIVGLSALSSTLPTFVSHFLPCLICHLVSLVLFSVFLPFHFGSLFPCRLSQIWQQSRWLLFKHFRAFFDTCLGDCLVFSEDAFLSSF